MSKKISVYLDGKLFLRDADLVIVSSETSQSIIFTLEINPKSKPLFAFSKSAYKVVAKDKVNKQTIFFYKCCVAPKTHDKYTFLIRWDSKEKCYGKVEFMKLSISNFFRKRW